MQRLPMLHGFSARIWISLVLIVLALGLLFSVDQSQAQSELNSAEAAPTADWISCTPINVTTYAIRLHVQCASPINGISYFAVSTSDADNAARVLSVISTAQVAGRTLTILYDPADTSGSPIGCAASSCRLILAAGFGQ